jgi:hypothetical protein
LLLLPFRLTKSSKELEQEVDSILEIHDRVFEIYSSLHDEQNRGRISNIQFAQSVENDVLAPWSEACLRLEKLSKGTEGNKAKIAQILRYFRLREEALKDIVRATSVSDPNLHARGVSLWDESEKAAAELFGETPPVSDSK